MLDEFTVINKYFTRTVQHNNNVIVGVGDDAAVLDVSQGFRWVTSVDISSAGIHFLENTPPAHIAHKALAVSLSDMAAMGAEPCSVLLGLSIPRCDHAWLQAFSTGFFALADQYRVDLVGGDTCRGPLSVSTTVNGQLPIGSALLRSGAQVGDHIYVSGYLGDACCALQLLQRNQSAIPTALLNKLQQPQPRVALGMALRSLAHAAIDVSDGLFADLQKILTASDVGAAIIAPHLPLSDTLLNQVENVHHAYQLALTGGDDYELCFTAAATAHEQIMQLASVLDCPITRIGKIVANRQLTVYADTDQDNTLTIDTAGYNHFK